MLHARLGDRGELVAAEHPPRRGEN
jgi:hypothetical protein